MEREAERQKDEALTYAKSVLTEKEKAEQKLSKMEPSLLKTTEDSTSQLNFFLMEFCLTGHQEIKFWFFLFPFDVKSVYFILLFSDKATSQTAELLV